MYVCASCGKEVEVDEYFKRTSTCAHCGEDLHVCLNCRFYSVTSHNSCLETRAEFIRVRDKANFCDYFTFRADKGEKSRSSGNADDVKKQFDDLFKS